MQEPEILSEICSSLEVKPASCEGIETNFKKDILVSDKLSKEFMIKVVSATVGAGLLMITILYYICSAMMRK